MRSRFTTSSLENNYDDRRYDIRVFTEQGIAILDTILKSESAIEVSIRTMDTFVSMRKFINENKDIFRRMTTMECKMLEWDDNFEKNI